MEDGCRASTEQWDTARKAGKNNSSYFTVLPRALNRKGATEGNRKTNRLALYKNIEARTSLGRGRAACFLKKHSETCREQNGNSFNSLRASFGETWENQ